MEKNIVFVGGSAVRSDNVTNLNFWSDNSLLDGDIIVFTVNISTYSSGNWYQGMPCLDDDSSFRLKRHIGHWRSELSAALTEGKTVISFVNDSPQVNAATGEMKYSGTGRNTRTTRIVATVDPYEVIPCNFGSVIRRSGERIKPAGELGILATYWKEFGSYSVYEAYIENFKGVPLLVTQTGSMAVGGTFRQATWKGTLIFLPPPDLAAIADSRVKDLKERQKKKRAQNPKTAARQAESYRNKAELSVAKQFIAALIGLDKAARNKADATPPPEWSQDDRFTLTKEVQLQTKIDQNIADALKLRNERDSLKQALGEAQKLKALLYEKGKPLEAAILIGLEILGFQAEHLQEGDSEIDAVIVDPEGKRFIGEAEGKDDKAINVDKLDQLDRNLKEDFSRQDDNTAEFALGVLFGNAFRLTAPENRAAFFTSKCVLAAKRSHIRLVRTTDLFNVARHLCNHPNEEFATACRRSIADVDGEVVIFPDITDNK
jgi:hypothetical protein